MIEKFKLDGTVADYALVVQKSNAVKEYKIVTEQDKASMQAQIIELTDSPAKNTQRILQKIGDVTTDAKELDAGGSPETYPEGECWRDGADQEAPPW